MITIDARNIKVLEDYFDEQSTRDQRGIFIASYRKAVKPLVSEAKANAPRDTGKLMRSIGTMDARNEIAILVGAMRPKGSHGHLNEDGTAMRYYVTKKNKVQKSTGKMTASHFFEAAYNSTEDEIFRTVSDEWYAEVERFIVRTNNKMK